MGLRTKNEKVRNLKNEKTNMTLIELKHCSTCVIIILRRIYTSCTHKSLSFL